MTEQSDSLAAWLAASEIVDHQHPAVLAQAGTLANGASDALDIARRCFTFVRDDIHHSFDVDAEPVTCRASEVLLIGHGICYAKTHLLAALLRANGIPAGFGYQRLGDGEGGFCLHGYNTVYLADFGWYRVDARGNTGTIDAQFSPPREQLAFSTSARGELDYRLNLVEPPRYVVKALQNARDLETLRRNLPSSIRMG